MFTILRQRNFGVLWAAGLISVIGDWVLFAALPYYIFQRTGSALATGAMFMASTIPRILFGSLTGVLVDQWDRQRLMVLADLSRATLVLALVLVRSSGWFWVIYLVAFVEASISLFFGPAKSAVIPRMVEKAQLMTANSLNGLSDNLGRLAGPSIGGALLALFGFGSVVIVDAASYLLSGILISLITIPVLAPTAANSAPVDLAATVATFWKQWLAGLRLLRKERWLTIFFAAMGISMIAQGIINVLLVVFVTQVLHGDAQAFGWIVSAQSVGGIAAGLILGKVGHTLAPARLLALSLGWVALTFLAIVNIPLLILAIILLATVGVPVMGWLISASTLLQSGVSDEFRGRVFGAYAATQALLMLIGMGLASGLNSYLGVIPLLDAAGILLLFAGLVALALPLEPAEASKNLRTKASS
jgi:MFS family permease